MACAARERLSTKFTNMLWAGGGRREQRTADGVCRDWPRSPGTCEPLKPPGATIVTQKRTFQVSPSAPAAQLLPDANALADQSAAEILPGKSRLVNTSRHIGTNLEKTLSFLSARNRLGPLRFAISRCVEAMCRSRQSDPCGPLCESRFRGPERPRCPRKTVRWRSRDDRIENHLDRSLHRRRPVTLSESFHPIPTRNPPPKSVAPPSHRWFQRFLPTRTHYFLCIARPRFASR